MHTRSREGDVRLLYQLMPDGAVSDASVYSSFPQGDFDDEALYAVRQWKAKWLHEPPQEPICMEQRILFCQREPGKKVSVVGCQ
jgi:TonB family protein